MSIYETIRDFPLVCLRTLYDKYFTRATEQNTVVLEYACLFDALMLSSVDSNDVRMAVGVILRSCCVEIYICIKAHRLKKQKNK